MRKELLATLLIAVFWIAAGLAVTYSTWYSSLKIVYPDYYRDPMISPYLLGAGLFGLALILTFFIIHRAFPSRATQRRKLMRMLDEVGVEDVEAIQRKLNAMSEEYGAETVERPVPLESLLREEKRKNRLESNR